MMGSHSTCWAVQVSGVWLCKMFSLLAKPQTVLVLGSVVCFLFRKYYENKIKGLFGGSPIGVFMAKKIPFVIFSRIS